MHRRLTTSRQATQITLGFAFAISTALATAGCASSSKTTLGLARPTVGHPAIGVGDTLGASMFAEHVRLAAAEARQRRALAREFATVHVPTD